LASSDICESVIGKEKLFSKKSPLQEIGKSILMWLPRRYLVCRRAHMLVNASGAPMALPNALSSRSA
jgi:hypothetical protein